MKKNRSGQEEKEFLYLSLFINDMNIPSAIVPSKDAFRITYKNDFNVLYDQYFDYLNDIFDFYLLYEDEDIAFENYEQIVTSYESIFQSVHDFFYSLDKELFKYQMNYILTSQEAPLEVIKKLDITLNKIIKMN